MWRDKNGLLQYSELNRLSEILKLRVERLQVLTLPAWESVCAGLDRLNLQLSEKHNVDTAVDLIRIGEAGDLPAELQQLVSQLIQQLIPWRKGPFVLFGEHIDAEWRSDFKWNRIAPYIPDLKHKKLIDIGCNNGYYMLHALEKQPELLYGIDPAERTFLQFALLQSFIRDPRLVFDLFGFEDLHLFPGFFDVALCMGILYHHRNPYKLLKEIKECLRPGATLIMESIVIPGEDSTALCVPERYAQMRNVYFVPTVNALKTMLLRSGFLDLEVLDVSKVTEAEQRSTPYAPFKSLSDFLDPNNSELTIEGFPAPYRACIKAIRRKD